MNKDVVDWFGRILLLHQLLMGGFTDWLTTQSLRLLLSSADADCICSHSQLLSSLIFVGNNCFVFNRCEPSFPTSCPGHKLNTVLEGFYCYVHLFNTIISMLFIDQALIMYWVVNIMRRTVKSEYFNHIFDKIASYWIRVRWTPDKLVFARLDLLVGLSIRSSIFLLN